MKSIRELEDDFQDGVLGVIKPPTAKEYDLERALSEALKKVSVNDASPRASGREYNPVDEGGGDVWI